MENAVRGLAFSLCVRRHLAVQSPQADEDRARSSAWRIHRFAAVLARHSPVEPLQEFFSSSQGRLHSKKEDIPHPIFVWWRAFAFTLLVHKDGPEADPIRMVAGFQVFVGATNRVLKRPNALENVLLLRSHVNARAIIAILTDERG